MTPIFEPIAAGMRPKGRVLALSAVGLAVFLAWEAVLLRVYIHNDTRPPSWDQAVHLEIAYDYLHAAREGRWSDIVHLAPKPGMPPFPPLYHLALAQAYSSADPAHAALWLNWVYLVVLSVSLFGILYYFRPDETALLGVVAFVCAPAVQDLYTTQLVDLAVVAWSAAAFWALLACDEFKSWPGSLAFGALYAVWMMHKWSFFSYMVPAYVVALKRVGDSRRLPKIAAAAAVALAGFGPWYWVHLPVLVPRLFQASSDFAVPVWQGGAFFNYLVYSADGLGPLLWILGWIGLIAPHYRRRPDRGWLVPCWILTSYLFWAIVPNRQMRFLLPGLPGLAVALCAAWPPALIWTTAATQALLGLNYVTGWVSPMHLPLPFYTMTVFASNPPRREDWRLAEILKTAHERVDRTMPVANLTLVANAPYFNGPNFTWQAKTLGFNDLHVRGVNGRLCEFSQFVVIKEGELGPPSVIGGLPEASATILDKKGWFPKAYAPAGRWPLPDGSHAELFKQRKLESAPFRWRTTQFQFYDSSAFSARDFRIDLGPWDASRGVYPLAMAKARTLKLRGLALSDVAVEGRDLALIPAGKPPAPQWDDVRVLRASRVKIVSASVAAEDLRAFLESRVHGLRVSKLSLDKTVFLEGAIGPLSVSAEAALALTKRPRGLKANLLWMKVGATPVPTSLLQGLRGLSVSFEPNAETPFILDIPGLTLAKGRLTIP